MSTKRTVDTSQYFLFVSRVLRGTARRAAEIDPSELVELVRLRDDLDDAIHMVVAGVRRSGATWEEIGSALGMTRQAAQQRWGSSREHA